MLSLEQGHPICADCTRDTYFGKISHEVTVYSQALVKIRVIVSPLGMETTKPYACQVGSVMCRIQQNYSGATYLM